MLPVVNVTTTNASEIDLNKDIVGSFQLGNGSVFKDNFLRSFEDEGVVLVSVGTV